MDDLYTQGATRACGIEKPFNTWILDLISKAFDMIMENMNVELKRRFLNSWQYHEA